MRKNNKKLMIVVSVLLSLVLITSSVVSGTMAKYVTSGSSSSSARVAKWGVTVDVDLDEQFEEACGDGVEITENGNSISVEIPNLKIGPGDDFSKAIKVSFSGKSEVRLKFNIDIDYSFDKSKFIVPAGVGNLTKDTRYFPFANTFSTLDISGNYVTNNANEPMTEGNYASIGNMEMFMCYELFFSLYGITSTGSYDYGGTGKVPNDLSSEKIFEAGENIVFHPVEVNEDTDEILSVNENIDINEFAFGMYWPFDYTSSDSNIDYGKIETWLANQKPTIGIVYTITIEQVRGDYETPDVDYGI